MKRMSETDRPYTTLSVTPEVKEAMAREKPQWMTWSRYLSKVAGVEA